MDKPLFDPITNSEDAMISRAHIKKYHACTYLRAHIIASLCFEQQFVVSDSSVNLNRAFRTLVDPREGEGNYKMDFLPKADFDWLIHEGHIKFATRGKTEGVFSEALRNAQKNKTTVDLPSERYTRRIDELCSNTSFYSYDLGKVSHRFTESFKRGIKDKLNGDDAITPDLELLLRRIDNRFADEETLTYSEVKSFVGDSHSEKDPEYECIYRILRDSYDYNVPKELHLDYCMPLQGIKPSRKQDWVLEMSRDMAVKCSFLCNVYGFAEFPAKYLKHLWESSEYDNFRRHINLFRSNTIQLDEYLLALKKYLERINEEIGDVYTIKHYRHEKGKLSDIPMQIRQYAKADDICVVLPKLLSDAKDIYDFAEGLVGNPASFLLQEAFLKVFPVVAQKADIFPDPPEEIREAIILQDHEETASCD